MIVPSQQPDDERMPYGLVRDLRQYALDLSYRDPPRGSARERVPQLDDWRLGVGNHGLLCVFGSLGPDALWVRCEVVAAVPDEHLVFVRPYGWVALLDACPPVPEDIALDYLRRAEAWCDELRAEVLS